MNLQEALRKEFVEQMGFVESDWQLIGIITVVAELVGNIEKPTDMAKKIVNKIVAGFPIEITHQGPKAIDNFFKQFGYDYMQEKSLEVATECK